MALPPLEYWESARANDSHACPNVTLFRFIGSNHIHISGKSILEIGFGANHGKDLLECQTRGGVVFGADINESYIADFSAKHPQIPTCKMNAGIDAFPFGISFDIIFHRDVIYYLSDEQIIFHFREVFKNLALNGIFIFQFIENDLTVNKADRPTRSFKLDFNLLKDAKQDHLFRAEANPLRKLDIDWLIRKAQETGFLLLSTKSVIESYTNDESVYRVNRYLMLKKQS